MPTGAYRGRVAWMDTDAAGIYHHSSVIRYIEAAEAELMRGIGIDFAPSAPRVRYEVEFMAPLRFDAEVVATIRVAGVGRTSMDFDFEVRDGDGALAARGRYTAVHVRHLDAGATPWPVQWRAALAADDA